MAAVLRLPLAGIVLAVLLTFSTGAGSGPLIIVEVVVAYLITLALVTRFEPGGSAAAQPEARQEAERAMVARGADAA